MGDLMKKTVAIFGGAFNPPTKGHKKVIETLSEKVDEVWVLPSYAHAHGKKPISFERRLKLVQILVDKIEKQNIKVSDEEKYCFEKMQKPFVYTYDLLCFLKEKYPEYDFKFSCGSDNAAPEQWKRFNNYKEIDKEFGKIVVQDEIDVRSTYIREAIQNKDFEKLLDYTYQEIVDEVINDY